MDEYPFENVVAFLSQSRRELIPQALQGRWQKRFANEKEIRVAANRWDRVLSGMATDDQLRSFLHNDATLRQWYVMDAAFHLTMGFLLRAEEGNVPARNLAAELFGCQTLLNAARLALRGPVL